MHDHTRRAANRLTSHFFIGLLGLRAKGTTIRRADAFAHFAGRAEIIHATPEPDVVLFTGNLELIARIGSHRRWENFVRLSSMWKAGSSDEDGGNSPR